jgi:WXG100 family type VII secretion target
MTTPPTSVDVQGMLAAQANFQNALDQVSTAYSDMSEQQSNLQANWAGETASTFGQALSQWLDDFKVVQTNLANILEALSAQTGIYANTNEGSQQMAAAFLNGTSGLPGLGIPPS